MAGTGTQRPEASDDAVGSGRAEAARDLATFLGALLIGAALAAALMPTLVRNAPTDIARIPHLLAALEKPGAAPEVIVLGNSVAMCGIDAKALSKDVADSPLAWNFASTGQTLLESTLFGQVLPASTRTVVLFVTHRELTTRDTLVPSKWNAFYLAGLRIEEGNKKAFVAAYPELEPLLSEGELEQRFRGRWVVPRIVDGGMRQLFRRDLTLSRATYDLFFPQPYTRALKGEKRERALARFLGREQELGYEVDGRRAELLARFTADLVAEGRDVLVVSPPVHPEIAAARGRSLPVDTRTFLSRLGERRGIRWLDASTLLGDDEFIDDVHPTGEGALRLTARVARELESR